VYGKQNIQEQKNLYVCFEVNRKNIFNLSFCMVIVNAPKNNQCFDEMARKYFQNVSFAYYFILLVEPGPHWWEASALTTAPSLLSLVCRTNVNCFTLDSTKTFAEFGFA